MNTIKHILESGIYCFWLCFLLHLLADYTLQGCLADLKQLTWWHNRVYPTAWRKYRHDYKAGLACHALMWSLMTFLPLMLVLSPERFSVTVLLNAGIHLAIDDLKTNKKALNLCEDQIAHFLQIVVTILIIYR